MGLFYAMYVGSPTGQAKAIHIPDFDAERASYTSRDVAEATGQNYNFDHTYTYFVKGSSTYSEMLRFGFLSDYMIPMYEYSSSIPLLLYADENRYIRVTNTSAEIYINGVKRGDISTSYLATSIASPHKSSIYAGGMGIRITSVSTDNFRWMIDDSLIYQAVAELFAGIEPIDPPGTETDPYLPDGTDPSGTGGGTGTFSDTGDMIGVPSLPTLSAVDTGFISLFNPSASQIKALANYMWSQNFDLSLFKNVVANPIDCILGLTIVPVDPPNAGTKALTVGNIPTDVSMPYLSSQYVEVDCGTLNIAEFWGSYLDYSPYTKIQLYLPYIGIVPVDIDDMQNSTIKVVYHVDVLSGACVAYVLCGGTQLYTYIGQCSSNVPVTSNDFTNTVNGILNIAGAVGSLVATEGATAPQAVGTIASSAVNMLKPNIQKSGSLSGTGGMLGVQTPYLICQRPRQSVPASQNHFTGYPSNITYTLSDLSGYTEVQNIHMDNVPCTDAEMNEILEYLTGGVVI